MADERIAPPHTLTSARPQEAETVPAGAMAPWTVGELIPPPQLKGRRLAGLLGPGILLAGSSIGAGEWLFGPAVSAQYGGTFLWLASISIIVQVFYNLEVMRYALYCGEPIFIGYFRTWPGPGIWTLCYLTLFLAHIWPFMASNAAVPLAAAALGHLPGEGQVKLAGMVIGEGALVKYLGYFVFVATLVPLVFGGKVYTMLERLMTAKIVLMLSFIAIVVVTMVSARNIIEVVTGFFRVGSVALRGETVIAGPHFSLTEHDGDIAYVLKGTMEDGKPLVTAFAVRKGTDDEQTYGMGAGASPVLEARRRRMAQRAASLARPDRFLVRSAETGTPLVLEGAIGSDGRWLPERIEVLGDPPRTYHRLEEIPEPDTDRARALVDNQGFERISFWKYWRQHGRLPHLDWALLAAFAAIAGAGGLSNALFSNYARDKGWGMGAKTGAIPSAFGGRTIELSHVGEVFRINPTNLDRWRGWFRHILRDQAAIWMVCSFVGMALPCMLSLEFIRNAPISENRVAAMTADGIAARVPNYAQLMWSLTLLCGFLALAPNAMMAGDLIARVWTDILWSSQILRGRLQGNQVKYVYYTILGAYAIWGLFALTMFNPLQIAKIGAVLGNIALGFSAFHTLFVNTTLLPRELRPNWFMQAGLICCGIFFLTITALVALD